MGIMLEAVKYGNLEIIKILIREGECVNDYNVFTGETPLMLASLFGRVKIVELLLENGARIEDRDNENCTAFYKAIQANILETAKILLNHRADVNILAYDDIISPLNFACVYEYTHSIKFLLEECDIV